MENTEINNIGEKFVEDKNNNKGNNNISNNNLININKLGEELNINDKPIVGLVLSCIDYRFMDETIKLLKKDCCVDYFDHTILAGASLGYNQNTYECWKKTFIEHLELAIELHDIKKIIVVDHEDCGAYKLFYPDIEPRLERKYHYINITDFIKSIKELYPDIPVEGYLLK